MLLDMGPKYDNCPLRLFSACDSLMAEGGNPSPDDLLKFCREIKVLVEVRRSFGETRYGEEAVGNAYDQLMSFPLAYIAANSDRISEAGISRGSAPTLVEIVNAARNYRTAFEGLPDDSHLRRPIPHG